MTNISRGPRGFTLPLTLALAFSIMSIAAGLTAMVTVKAKAARQRDADVFAQVTLESGVQAGLSTLEREGVPVAPRWTSAEQLNNRQVELTWLAPGYKTDIGSDKPAVIGEAVVDKGLKGRVLDALTDTTTRPPSRAGYFRIRDFFARVQATPGEEDCLRALLTLGRMTPEATALPPKTVLRPPQVKLLPGDVVEVRAAIRSDRYTDVLWQRLRYTGTPGQPWHIHDWRRLRLAGAPSVCRPPGS